MLEINDEDILDHIIEIDESDLLEPIVIPQFCNICGHSHAPVCEEQS